MPHKRGISILVALLAAAAPFVAAQAAAQGAEGFNTESSHTDSAAGGSTIASQCVRECITKAEQLGYEKLVADSLACVLPYKGTNMYLSSADCCDKAELLFGRHGSMAHCMCCPGFVRELLAAVPLEQLHVTHDEFVDKLNLCRVPLVTTPACGPGAAKERAPLPVGSNGPYFSMPNTDKPLVSQLNLTGFYPYAMGLPTKYTPSRLSAQGAIATARGQEPPTKLVGVGPFFNNYVTGYMALIGRETVPAAIAASTKLPALPEQHKADLAWVAGLRRGPMPDLIRGRPEEYTPARTDPLQNGEVANRSPGVVFAGRIPAMNQP